jgi:leucyl/phenylalanyl-tRNA--protein transferase
MVALTPEILLHAYASGVFPMAEGRDDRNLFWIDPEVRGILPLEKFHISQRLARKIRSNTFDVRVSTAFQEVMEGCSEPRDDADSTWINDEIISLYCGLNKTGAAQSIECWQDGKLVGGLYGVALGAAFFGESMFSRATDASKVALVYLVARLKFGHYQLLDIQFVTDHLSQFGATGIPRKEYHRRLEEAVQRKADFLRLPQGTLSRRVLEIAGG